MSTDDTAPQAARPTAGLPAPTPTVWPSIGFTDVDAGIRFLTEVLGLVVTSLHRDDDGTVGHAEARWPEGGGVMFGSRGRPGDWGTLGPQGVYVAAAEVATVEDVWQRVQASDVEVLQPLHGTDYDPATFSVRDRDGNLWSVGTYRGE